MKLQLRIWQLVTSRGFEYSLFTLIIINTVALAMKVLAAVLLFGTRTKTVTGKIVNQKPPYSRK